MFKIEWSKAKHGCHTLLCPIFEDQMNETIPSVVQTAIDIAFQKDLSDSYIYITKNELGNSIPLCSFKSQLSVSINPSLLSVQHCSLFLVHSYNPIFLLLEDSQSHYFSNLNDLWRQCLQLEIGIVYTVSTPHTLDPTECIHVWIRPQSPRLGFVPCSAGWQS